MDLKHEIRRVRFGIDQIVNFGLRLLFHFLHLLLGFWHLGVGIVNGLESYLISSGVLRHYKALDVSKLQSLAIVVDSDDARRVYDVIKLVQWLEAIGLKHLCLYDTEGILKKCKESIVKELKNPVSFEEVDGQDLQNKKYMILEFASVSDGKEAVVKAANLLLLEYIKSANTGAVPEDQIFTEARMTEALKAVGCNGPEPELLLVYGPARCHLGFPAWRIKYTEIVHMGPLKSIRYGTLMKAMYKFTMIHQNYGK